MQIGNRLSTAFYGVAAEFLFVVLPLIVTALALGFRGEAVGNILASPAWSFTSATLGSLTLFRLASGLARAPGPSLERVSLLISLVLMIALLPALMILALVVIRAEHPLSSLVSAQVVQFCICAAVYLFFGTAVRFRVDLQTEIGDGDAIPLGVAQHKRIEVESAVLDALNSSRLNPRVQERERQDE